MKMFNLNSRLARRATATIALGLLLGAQTAMACTVDNWTANSNSLTPGSVIPGSPTAVSRYSGFCGMEVAPAAVSWVQDDSPGGIDRIRARFYVLNDLAAGQSAQIYRGFGSTTGSGPLFTVTLNDSGQVVLRDNVVVQSVSQSTATKWASVEIDWSQGSGDGVISLSVNGQPAEVISNLSNSAGATLESVRLGNLNGAGGFLSFDAYESRRTTEIGRLLACNADPSDEQINILDALAVINEINEVELSAGQPDCDEDGLVTILDALDIINIINS